MPPIIAIHSREGSFSDRWTQEINKRELILKIVDCYSNTILEDLSDCRALLWHWTQESPADLILARHILQACEMRGIKTFPNVATCWHFDDKIAQKYLLESVNAPIACSYVFIEKDKALQWIESAEWPKVFKLRRGAGSQNVRLVESPSEARKLVKSAFGRGFKPYRNVWSDLPTKARKSIGKRMAWKKVLRLPIIAYRVWKKNNIIEREKGYAYFQDFLPDNHSDTRVTIIGKRAFGFIRYVRPGDFRASGSGLIDHDIRKIDMNCVEIAFRTSSAITAQSMAFDFVYDSDRKPKIVEVSYGYLAEAVYECPGYWDEKLNWHPGHVWPQDMILDDMLVSLS